MLLGDRPPVSTCRVLVCLALSVLGSSGENGPKSCLTIQFLNCFSIWPVQLKCRFLGNIIWLHYGSHPVGMRQAEDMANFMDSHLGGGHKPWKQGQS